MTLDFSGRVVLVTGASRGIGRAVAEHFGRAGATLALHYGHAAAAAEALQREIGGALFQAGLANPAAADALVRDVIGQFGRLDVLVNNAGIYAEEPDDLAGYLGTWERTLNVNLVAAAVAGRAALAQFAERRMADPAFVGRIVSVTSRAAHRGDGAAYGAYAASKAGLTALTKTWARAHGPAAVAFAVAPGFTRTDMAEAFIAQHGEAAATAGAALGRLTEPGDLAPAVLLFASGLADHATGATLDLNAGSYVR